MFWSITSVFCLKITGKVQSCYSFFLSYSVAETQSFMPSLKGSKNSSGISFKLSFWCFVCSILQDFELSLDQPASIGEFCPEDKSLHSKRKWEVTHAHLHHLILNALCPDSCTSPGPPTWMLLLHSLFRALVQTIIQSLLKDRSGLNHMEGFLALYIAFCHIHSLAGIHNEIWLKGAEPMK